MAKCYVDPRSSVNIDIYAGTIVPLTDAFTDG